MTHFDFVVYSGELVKIYARLLGTPYAISNQEMEEKRQKTMVTKTVDFISIVCVLPLTFHNLRRKQSKIVHDGIFSPTIPCCNCKYHQQSITEMRKKPGCFS